MSSQRKTYPKVFVTTVSEKETTNTKNRQRKRAIRGPKIKHYSE
jgi:hypothetical protein